MPLPNVACLPHNLPVSLSKSPTHKTPPPCSEAFRQRIIGEPVGHSLQGKTLGIVGRGRVGNCLAESAAALGMKVLSTDSKSSRWGGVGWMWGCADGDAQGWTAFALTRCAAEPLRRITPEGLTCSSGHGPLSVTSAVSLRPFSSCHLCVVMCCFLRAAVLFTNRQKFEELLRVSDVVSLHCHLNDATRGLISQPELALMRPGAVLVNTARGHIVDKQALLQALRNGLLGGVGLDVGWDEPDDPQEELYRWVG